MSDLQNSYYVETFYDRVSKSAFLVISKQTDHDLSLLTGMSGFSF